MGGTAYRLDLRLGSNTVPTTGMEKADHFLLPTVKLGKSLPLIGETSSPGSYTPEGPGSDAPGSTMPKGRLLLFWGCGANTPKGQPVILDFSKLAKGQVPPGLWSTKVPNESRVSARDFKYYADWPNSSKDKQPKVGSSLLGEHRIAGNFAPEIKFSLTQDYMGPLNAKDSEQANGSILLSWNGLAPATGYLAWAMGGAGDPDGDSGSDTVWWTSSTQREFGGGLWDFLAPTTVAKLVQQKIVMPPGQTSCQIPAEVKAAAKGYLFGNLNAFGPEANYSFPPRPADPKATWNIDWTTRVRFRSHDMLMIGMGDMIGGMDDEGAAASQPKPKEKKKCKGPFGVSVPCPF